MDIIGMTAMPETRLAREAELCYASLPLVTDHHCWHGDGESVGADLVLAQMAKNAFAARQALASLLQIVPDTHGCACGEALATAVITSRATVPAVVRDGLDLLIGKYPSC